MLSSWLVLWDGVQCSWEFYEVYELQNWEYILNHTATDILKYMLNI